MTDKLVEITEDEFERQYPLVSNHLNLHASWACGDSGRGCLFETFGEELAFVRQHAPATIWTLIDGEDGELYVVSGFRFVNRLGYLLSAVPVPAGVMVEVCLSSPTDEPANIDP